MEYCSEGDLSHILKEKNHLTEKEAQFFLGQLASALQVFILSIVAFIAQYSYDNKIASFSIYINGKLHILI